MGTRPIVLSIAGSDSGGGAGIQADLKTFTLLGCFGTTALTAVTAQNTLGVHAVVTLEPDFIVRQIDAVADDLRPDVTKTGMLASAAIVRAVADAIRRHRLFPLVVDPVMIAKGGQRLIDDAAIDALGEHLLPLATIVTPNRFEAARLAGFAIDDPAAAARAARAICQRLGAGACVVKGVRLDAPDGPATIDSVCLAGADESFTLAGRWLNPRTCNTHGSGCTFSAALAAFMAREMPLREALERARAFTAAAIAGPARLGRGTPPVDHLAGNP